jgi:hypothetical protein
MIAEIEERVVRPVSQTLPMSHTSDLEDAALSALERIARNVAFEQRLRREGAPNLGKAIAAIHRETLRIAESASLLTSTDDSGDIWVVVDGRPVAFVGNVHALAA